ncbi:MAG: hypothetical protein WC890_04430 [Candidatus Margulisiibacteriota bacterium]
MKNKTLFVLAITLVVVFCIADSASASKVVRKSVRKVVEPAIAPVPPPATSTQEVILTPPPASTTETEVKLPGKKKGLLGWSQNADFGAAYQLCSGQQGLLGLIGARGDFVFDDPWQLGGKVGLAQDAVQYKAGIGLYFGNDSNNNPISTIPLFGEAIIYLPENCFFGYDPYFNVGLNFNLYGTNQTFGGIGSQFGAGILVDSGLGLEKTAIGIGFNSFNVGSIRSASGISLSFSQPIIL